MTTRTLSVVFFLLGLGAVLRPVHAQVRPQGDIHLLVGIPQGAFSDQVDNPGIGLDALLGVTMDGSPFLVGVDLGFLIYGSERRREPFSPTIPDVTVDVETTNNIFLGHMLFRLQPDYGAIQPYLDGLVGLKHFFTQTSVQNERGNGGEPIATSTNFNDTALSYGVGGGVGITVYTGVGGAHKLRSLDVNLGVRYLFGGEAEYLAEGGVRHDTAGNVTYETRRSRTDLLLPHAGVTLRF